MVRCSNGSWLYKRGAQWPKERFWVSCLDKKGSTNLLDTELWGLEIRTRCNRFQCIEVHLIAKIYEPTNISWNPIALGIILSVLYLGIFTMNLILAFKINWRPSKSTFVSPYNKALQICICVRTKQCTVNFAVFLNIYKTIFIRNNP